MRMARELNLCLLPFDFRPIYTTPFDAIRRHPCYPAIRRYPPQSAQRYYPGMFWGVSGMAYYDNSANGALTSLNISANELGGYEDFEGEWISDMAGIQALAAAIPQCK